jgi:hypothetical protein
MEAVRGGGRTLVQFMHRVAKNGSLPESEVKFPQHHELFWTTLRSFRCYRLIYLTDELIAT